MRFTRWPRYPFNETDLKRQFLRRKLASCRLVTGAYLDARVGEIMADRAARWDVAEREDRAKRAADWRSVRRRLYAMSANERAVVLGYWNSRRFGGSVGADVHCMLARYDRGQISLDEMAQRTAEARALDLRFGRKAA